MNIDTTGSEAAVIAAVGRDRALGRKGALVWRISDDLRHFKALTMGHPVIMGRKTWESIGRPLPGRLNIVVSRDDTFCPEGAVVCRSPLAALEEARSAGEGRFPFVIGGGEIYRELMPLATRLYLTEIDDVCQDADTRFPEIDPAVWRETGREPCPDDGRRPRYSFVTYLRVEPSRVL